MITITIELSDKEEALLKVALKKQRKASNAWSDERGYARREASLEHVAEAILGMTLETLYGKEVAE